MVPSPPDQTPLAPPQNSPEITSVESSAQQETAPEKPLTAPQTLAELLHEKPKKNSTDLASETNQNSESNKLEKLRSDAQSTQVSAQQHSAEAPIATFPQQKKLWQKTAGVVLALFLVSILFFLSSIFPQSQTPQAFTLPNLEPKEGQVFLTDPFTQKATLLTTEKTLSEPAKIQTGTASEADINLSTTGEVRLSPETEVAFLPANTPIFTLQNGDLWIFALQKIVLETENYRFILDNGSANFHLSQNSLAVSTWENNLQVLQKNPSGEMQALLTFPPLSHGLFPAGEAYVERAEIYPKLRFSKLMKEFQVQAAVPEAEDTVNLRRDQDLRTKYATEITTGDSSTASWRAHVAYFFSFFSEQKAQHFQLITASQMQEFLTALNTENLPMAQKNLATNQFPPETLQKLLRNVLLLENIIPEKQGRPLLEDNIFAKTPSEERPKALEQFLRNAFYALQKSFAIKDTSWRDREMARIQELWGKDQTLNSLRPESVSFYRETFFRLLMQNPSVVNDDLLKFLHFLDATELANVPTTEESTTQLEIVQKNLSLAAALITAKKTDTAKPLLAVSQSILEKMNTAAEQTAINNLKHELLASQRRWQSCASFDVCGIAEFNTWLSSKRIVACQLEQVCSGADFETWLQNLLSGKLKASAPDEAATQPHIDPFQEAKEALKVEEITLEAGHIATDRSFLITRARTKDDILFMGTLALDDGYLTDVSTLDGKKISGVISLPSLADVIYRTVFPEPLLLPENAGTEHSPTSDSTLDPIIADLTVRSLQPNLLDAGFIVLRTDMVPESTTTVHVLHALAGVGKIPVTFDYVVRKNPNEQILEKVNFEEYPTLNIPETTLSEAVEKITALANTAIKEQKLLDQALSLLLRSGFTLSRESLSLTLTENVVEFHDLHDQVNQLNFSGKMNVATQVFLLLKEPSKKIEVQNIPLSEYHRLVAPPISQGTEQISPQLEKQIQEMLDTKTSTPATPSATPAA